MPGAVLVTVNTRRIEDRTDHALQVWGKDKKKKWGHNILADVGDEQISAFNECLSRQLQHEVYDMDDHFDDVSLNWQNTHIDSVIESL
mmetsp:Transcript_13037/g.16717  ORF Transcript_13037/g.16717 Transcript_13037/m.16717 type:complete len:88 (+) Transcript_13037:266-529(+)